MRERISCFSPSNLKTPIWTSGNEMRSFYGPYMIINNLFFLFAEDGELLVYEILRQSMKLVKRQRIMEGKDAFQPMAYADGILLLGDDRTLKAVRIAKF